MPAPPPESEPAMVRTVILPASCVRGAAFPMRDVLKLVRDLQRRKARERRSLVVLEGRRLVEDALEAGAKIEALLLAEDADAEPLGARATAAGIDVQRV